jgi:predicted site-specific integrase-resolvase
MRRSKEEIGQDLLADYLSETELARILGRTQRTLLRWRSIGKAPPYTRVGGRILYRIEAVRKWLEAREATGSREDASSGVSSRKARRS